ncbi:MAG TPA: hypothetical protein VFV43_00420, partial [Limnobacter sp.]|nr:hypothetical protein [Limnobacter sp.]
MSPSYTSCRGLDVLFVSYGGGHITAVLPLANAMQAKGYKVGVFALTTATGVMAAQNVVPWFGYSQLPQFDGHAQALGQRYQTEVEENPLMSLQESIAYMGLNMQQLIADHGEEGAKQRLQTEGRRAFLPVALCKQILADLAPRLLMSTNSPRTEQATFLAARALGIPSVALIDQFGALDVQRMSQAGYGDVVCVLNDWVKDRLIALGRPAQDVVVTGNPAFDFLWDPQLLAHGKQLRQNLAPGHRTVILWASQNEPPPGPANMPVLVEQALRSYVASRQDTALLVRYHPSQKMEFVPQAHVFLSPSSDQLEAVLHACDVVVTRNSTVGLQGALVGKGLIAANFGNPRKGIRFEEVGLCRAVDNAHELANEIQRLT